FSFCFFILYRLITCVTDLTPPRCLRLHLAAHNPVAAASNPSPCTSPPPPPPPLTACKNCRNTTPTWRTTPTHGGRINGGNVVAAGMAMVACQEQWQRGSGNDSSGTPVLPLYISVLYFTSMQ
ncbi:hypothetical protein EDB86DRAFT_2965203, partial [Lactarius hatsudake]